MKQTKREAIIGYNSESTFVVIKLPTSLVLRIMSRSLFLAIVILALPSTGAFLGGSSSPLYDSKTIKSRPIDVDLLPLLFHDFIEQGLVKKGDRALILGSDVEELFDLLRFAGENEIHLVVELGPVSQSMVLDESFDCVLPLSSRDGKFGDRVLKIGGLLVVKLEDDPMNALLKLSNYKIVYIRRSNSTIVGMKKTGSSNELVDTEEKNCICGQSEGNKLALKGIEEALLEPPLKRELAKSSDYLMKIKFLPDLSSNSFESYSRRIFITDDNKNGSFVRWFHQNYPKKNHHFEVYDTEKMNDLALFGRRVNTGAISDWFNKRNVRDEDFVVMKANAELVEDMMREKMICLVDELFLECEFQRQGIREKNKGKRAYWECLALFGKLRDEGIAVHQWWG